MLTWKTGGEAHNLGFNVYREQNGNRVRMNASLIAGSALLMSGAQPKHAGRSYAWIDASKDAWRERVDFVDAPLVSVSASTVRDRVRAGLPIDGLVPPAVADYIHAHRLYTDPP